MFNEGQCLQQLGALVRNLLSGMKFSVSPNPHYRVEGLAHLLISERPSNLDREIYKIQARLASIASQ